MAGISGVPAGSSGLFIANLVPAGAAALQSGPVFSSTTNKVTITPTNDPFAVVVGVPNGHVGSSCNLTIRGRTSSGEISNTFAIPILKPH